MDDWQQNKQAPQTFKNINKKEDKLNYHSKKNIAGENIAKRNIKLKNAGLADKSQYKGFWRKLIAFPFKLFLLICGKKLNVSDKVSLLKSINKVIENSELCGLIASEEKKMIKNIINIGGVKVDDVMIPRTDIIAVQENTNLVKIKALVVAGEHTRMPVFQENLDEVIGFIHSKDLLKYLDSRTSDFKINNIIRKILYVPNSMGIIDLLLKMRASHVHIAIVLDEYGGTDGLVTIEDIVEEIVGEIEDEHDFPDNNIYTIIKRISSNIIHVGGRVEIEKVEDLLSHKIISDNVRSDFETVGGLVLAKLKKVPEIGEIVKHSSGLTFKVLDADMRSVKLVEIIKEIPDEKAK